MTELVVVTQDPRFRGGALAQTRAFVEAAQALGHRTTTLHPPIVPLVDSVNQLVRAPGIARRARAAESLWVVAAAASYGWGAARSGRPYQAWIGTSLDDEWSARRDGLGRRRRLALAANAPLLRRLERTVLRGAERVYATSPASRAALAAASGLAVADVEILRIPVDTDLFAPEPEADWVARLDEPVVVFVGRGDDPRKNVGLLLAAWPAIQAAVPGARLRLVGRPPAQPLPRGATAAGEVASVAEALRGANLFVLPSLQEGFGIVAAEALAAGVPAVVTPSGGPEELIAASGGGVVLPDFRPATLADAVVGLLTDERRLRDARRRGRAYVEEHHSLPAFREQLRGILEGGRNG